MIKQWSLEHFKSVAAPLTLDLAPLTIFVGANSSGKSTIIQSILLTAQTIQSAVLARPVILNGHIVRLGQFSDIVSNRFRDEPIKVGFVLSENTRDVRRGVVLSDPRLSGYGRFNTQHCLVTCSYSFSASFGAEQEREIAQLQPRLEESYIHVRIAGQDGDDDSRVEEEVRLKRSTEPIQERLVRFKLEPANINDDESKAVEYEVLRPSLLPAQRIARRIEGFPQDSKIAGASLKHFLPGDFTVVFDAVERDASQLIESFTSDASRYRYLLDTDKLTQRKLSEHFLNEIVSIAEAMEADPATRLSTRTHGHLQQFLQDRSVATFQKFFASMPYTNQRDWTLRVRDKRGELLQHARGGRGPQYALGQVPLSPAVELGVDVVQQFFARNLRYLGPLRDEPKSVYPLAGVMDPRDTGLKGEHTAAVLELHRNTLVEVIPSGVLEADDGALKPVSMPLLAAVHDWLAYMGVGSKLVTSDYGKLGHKLEVATVGNVSLHDLTHVGVGVSQVLPILVLSLIAEPGSTLIFEQPELHLHPRVQTRLADFFVSMMLLRKQCIIETHSEYFVNRLRYRAAKARTASIADNVALFFVEKINDSSSYRRVKINDYGVIEDWPDGFFDEAEKLAAATLRAAMEKKKRKQRGID
jgi:predicted ATPase